MATVIPIHSPLPAPAEPARARPAEQPARLSGWRLAAFSSFAVPVAAAQMPVGVYLPAIYAQHYGIPLATLGLPGFGFLVCESLTAEIMPPSMTSLRCFSSVASTVVCEQ